MFPIFVLSQNKRGKTNDAGRIVLNTFLGNIDNVPSGAVKLLNNKISQIASGNGMGGNESFPRFIISADIDVLTKDINKNSGKPISSIYYFLEFMISF